MAALLQELSSLDIEALEIVVSTPASEQKRNLETLTTLSDVEVAALLTGTLPTNGACCCCCCPACCCSGCCC